MFFIQMQTFEDLLKSEKLKPFEQMKVRATNSQFKSVTHTELLLMAASYAN